VIQHHARRYKVKNNVVALGKALARQKRAERSPARTCRFGTGGGFALIFFVSFLHQGKKEKDKNRKRLAK